MKIRRLRYPLREHVKEPEAWLEVFQGTTTASGDFIMGRGLILWLVGIPLPVILILYFLGYLH